MNIFFLDENPTLSAQYHVDKHVVKMILETAQLLCGVHHVTAHDSTHVPYKLSHKNHPCSIWCRESLSNYLYLCELGLELSKEYTYRYGKRHKSQDVIEWCLINKPNIPDIEFTDPAKAMPDEFKVDSVVESYRNYYMGAKFSLAAWKNREKPFWFEKKELTLEYD
jgi:hypothetical protein